MLIISQLVPLLDILAAPVTWLSSYFMRRLRTVGFDRLPVSRTILEHVGVYPCSHDYHGPLVSAKSLRQTGQAVRDLPGLNLRISAQIEFMQTLDFASELRALSISGRFANEWFGAGDGEFYYSVVRSAKPRNIIEVGCGFSTVVAHDAVSRNMTEDPTYSCATWCIDPLEDRIVPKVPSVRYIPQEIQAIDPSFLEQLVANDILFIDSSHIVKTGSDVVFLFTSILPRLKPGVLIHIHDIYTPADMPDDITLTQKLSWNEQYILEALLTDTARFEVVASLNYLWHHHRAHLGRVCPIAVLEQVEPVSFWIRRV